jgi:hypothetical protein
VARQRSVQEACIHQVAGQTATPVGQIADAQASLEYGTVTESDTLQAKGPGLTGSGWSGLELAEDLNHSGGLLVTDFTRSYLLVTNATPGGRPTEIPGFARSPGAGNPDGGEADRDQGAKGNAAHAYERQVPGISRPL